MPAERAYDIVLFGATGFTGGLTADYLAAHAPAGTRIALAGRNPAKLAAVAERLGGLCAPGVEVPALLPADAGDPVSLARLAADARVVISTVGPYLRYGEPLVAACAAAGTGYLDLTGEPEFVDTMYLRYHAQALATGARLIHAAGFDSIPHDLGVLFTVAQMPTGVPLAVNGYVQARGTFSGGTYHSAIGALARVREAGRIARQRQALERAGAPVDGRRVRGAARPPHRVEVAGGWVLALPLIDAQIVLASARALPEYGPDFRYGHYLAAGSLANVALILSAVGGLAVAAQAGPTRRLALKLRLPGDGPDEATRARSRFRVTFAAEGGGETLTTWVAGGDPGYGETSKMLAEAALCLAFDDVPACAGQVTTAQALGRPLIDRLISAGIEFGTDSRPAATPA
ncbi:trans-acting enoyl reductase family protein [Conexibacter sp. DBS9H8]|uniref:saccharopine dehydrogenase family protein n=1 Tax=Conexibacter sp. DBS9H8 TaxID=2937801 RepID=UPI00200DCBA9|nr:saccharopine dehydrogenase NADP-binding domain-containing protein [Conexibacter sp. DBS9H8]